MRVNHNIPALYAYNSVNATNRGMQKAIEKLSSGLRINSAADDAAGLAISEKMRGQVRGLDQAMGNAQDGINMIQTAEGALSETHSILQRMRELSVNAANDTLTANDRQAIQLEIDQLTEEVDRISNTTQFNKKKLLNGDAAALWSTDSLDTKVTVRGGLRTIDQFGQKSSAEGNYKIEAEVTSAGKAQVLKSNIFKMKHASTGGGEATTSRIDNAAELDLGEVSGFLNKSEANDIQKVLLRVTESAGGSNLFTEVTVSIEATSNMKGADVLDQLASKLTDALNNAGGNFGNLNFSVDTVNGVLVASVAAGAFAINFSDFSANYTSGKKILNDAGASVQMQGAFQLGAPVDFHISVGGTATVGIQVTDGAGLDLGTDAGAFSAYVMAKGWTDEVTATFNFKDNSGNALGTINVDVSSTTSNMDNDAVGTAIVNGLNSQLQASGNVNLMNVEAVYDSSTDKLSLKLKDELATRDIVVDWSLNGSYESLNYADVEIDGETASTEDGHIRYTGEVGTTDMGAVEGHLNANESGGIKGSLVVAKQVFDGEREFTLDYQVDARTGNQTTEEILNDIAAQLNSQIAETKELYENSAHKLNAVVSVNGNNYNIVFSNTLKGNAGDYGEVTISAGSYVELGAASNLVTAAAGVSLSALAAVNIIVDVGANTDLFLADMSSGVSMATQLGGDTATATFNFKVGTSVTSVEVDVTEDYTDETASTDAKALDTLVTNLNKELIASGLNDIKAYVGDDGNLAFNTKNTSQTTYVNWSVDNTGVTSTDGVGLTINNKTSESEWTTISKNIKLGGSSLGVISGSLFKAKAAETLTGSASVSYKGSSIEFDISITADNGNMSEAETLEALASALNEGIKGYAAESEIMFVVDTGLRNIQVKSLTGGNIAAANFAGLTLSLDPGEVKMVENASSDKYELTIDTQGVDISTSGTPLKTAVGGVTFWGELNGSKEADVVRGSYTFTFGGESRTLEVDFSAEDSDITNSGAMAEMMASRINEALKDSGDDLLSSVRAYAVKNGTDWELYMGTASGGSLSVSNSSQLGASSFASSLGAPSMYLSWSLDNSGNTGTSLYLDGSSHSAVSIGYSPLTATEVAAFSGSSSADVGEVASLTTSLYDIDKFWDSNGRFLLEDPQTISIIQGNGKKNPDNPLYRRDFGRCRKKNSRGHISRFVVL